MRNVAFSAAQLGEMFRKERKAQRRTQQWVAQLIGCRRQTIIDLEAGRNVSIYTILNALAALDKGLAIMSTRIDLDRISDLWDEPDEED